MNTSPANPERQLGCPLRILLVEDDEGLAILFLEALAPTGLEFDSVRSGREAMDFLAVHPNSLVLLDYSLPDMTANQLIEAMTKSGSVPPFIVITGHGDERVAVNMMRLGAHDYLVKDAFLLDRLPVVVDRVLKDVQMRRQLAESEAAMRASEDRYHRLFKDANEGIVLIDAETGKILDCNQAFLRLTGYAKPDLIGQPHSMLQLPESSHKADSKSLDWHRAAEVSTVIQDHVVTKNGPVKQVEIKASLLEIGGRKLTQAFIRDVTEERRNYFERETTIHLLRLLNDSNHTQELIRSLTAFIQEWSGCEAVGVRLRQGDDFPYFETRGFPAEFVEVENHLCIRSLDGQVVRDSQGYPVLECMCGNILCGRFDPSKPFFTAKGSFWTNHTTALLATSTEADRQARTRNRCNGEGYESVALFALRSGGQTLGLLQLNDRAIGRFTPELIAFLENAADQIAAVISQRQAQAELKASEERYRELVELAPDPIFVHCEGKFAYLNPAALRLFGANTAEDMVGRPFLESVHPPYREIVAARTHTVHVLREAVPLVELKYLRLDGQSVDVETVARPFTFQGRPAGQIIARDITERKRAELELVKARDFHLGILNQAPALIWRAGLDAKCDWFNATWLAFTGRTMEEEVGDGWAAGVYSGDLDQCVKTYIEAFHARRPFEMEYRLRRHDGTYRWIADYGRPFNSLNGEFGGFIGYCFDLTERKVLEDQFRQAQKMEAVGQLAGGVAHDFNNILAAIMMHLSLLLDDSQLLPDMRSSLKELESEAKRAASLTRQLLMFSRRQVMQPEPLELNEVMAEMLKMLRRLLGEHIVLTFCGGSTPLWIEADAGMMEQIVMNLCVNARDAMPGGGQIRLETRLVDVDADYARANVEARPGKFVCLSVTDVGCGMDSEVLKHIFEPFYTTKDVGKGTGLGLASVFGIVKQHKGWIEVESHVGQGTTFSVFLPALTKSANAQIESPGETIIGGTEIILVVEDEPSLRRIAVLLLRRYGYVVLEAANGMEAMRLWEQQAQQVDLLFTDMVMPEGITGLELWERFKREKSSLKVIISSGYSVEMNELGLTKTPGIVYLAKPYEGKTLAATVRKCLDQR